MKYKIGMIARLFGISPQTIRFYQQEQLLRDKDAGATRYYEAQEFKRITSIRRYMGMGFGTREIREMFDMNSVDTLKQRIRDKKLDTYDEIMHLQRRIYALDRHEEQLHCAESLLEKCEIADCPELLVFMSQTGNQVHNDEDTEARFQSWAGHLDMVSSATMIPLETLTTEEVKADRESGYCIPVELAERFGIPMTGVKITRFPSCPCLHTVACLDAPGKDIRHFAPHLIETAQRQGLRFTRDAIGITICVLKESDNGSGKEPRRVLYEIWAPIEKASAI